MKILFVCSGNTCRSPMAMAIYNARAAELGLEPAESAGTSAVDGEAASENAQKAVIDYGAELSAHRSRQVTREMLAAADRIYYMTPYNYALLYAIAPEFKDKYYPLSPDGIPDPYGGSLDDYILCAAKLELALRPILRGQK